MILSLCIASQLAAVAVILPLFARKLGFQDLLNFETSAEAKKVLLERDLW